MKKIAKLLKNKTYKYYLLLLISLFIEEIIFKGVIGFPILDWSIFRVFIGINILSLVFGIIFSFCKKKVCDIVAFILNLILSIIFIVQAGLYNYFGTFMSLNTASQAGAVGEFLGDFLGSIKFNYYLLLIPSILVLIYIIFIDKKLLVEDKSKKKKGKKKVEVINYSQSRGIALGASLVLFFIYYFSLSIPFMQNSLQMVSNKKLFHNPSMPNIAVSQFGLIGYEYVDIKGLIIGVATEAEEFAKEEQIVTDYSRVIDDTLWEEAQDLETNKDYKTLNSYFMSKKITEKNDYTGLFAGKNLIVIMIESGSNVLSGYPEYFPNFNKLYNEGWSFTNAFSPRNSCSTGNNEMSGLTSLYTINTTCTINTYKDNDYYEAIFNLFNNMGYQTSSYHDYTDHFYARHTYHPKMGSMNYYGVDELNIKLGSGYQPWPSDVEFVEKAYPHIDTMEDMSYMAWLTTVSTHMTYSGSSVTGDMNLDMFKDQKWPTAAKRYMSKLKIFDNALGKLLELLEEDGKLEDTVIAMFADHYPYGLSDKEFKSIAKYDISLSGDVDRTPFVIYNSSLEPKKFEQYTTYINVLPTLANLFDLDYDPRLYGGMDLFSEEYDDIVVFADGSWRSKIAYYDAPTSKITYIGEEEYSKEEIVKINTKVTNEIKMNNLAIKTNYFKYLSEILDKKEEVKEIEQ